MLPAASSHISSHSTDGCRSANGITLRQGCPYVVPGVFKPSDPKTLATTFEKTNRLLLSSTIQHLVMGNSINHQPLPPRTPHTMLDGTRRGGEVGRAHEVRKNARAQSSYYHFPTDWMVMWGCHGWNPWERLIPNHPQSGLRRPLSFQNWCLLLGHTPIGCTTRRGMVTQMDA